MGRLFGAGYLNIFITCVILCNLKGRSNVAFQIPHVFKAKQTYFMQGCQDTALTYEGVKLKYGRPLMYSFRLNTVTKPWCGTYTLLMNEKHFIH